jgi:hypothetical protein
MSKSIPTPADVIAATDGAYVLTDAPVTVATADEFRSAIAAASVAGSTSTVATAVLKSVTLDRYMATIAAHPAWTRNGTLIERHAKDVSTLLWLEATGSLQAPKAKERTAGETSLGQYLSRFGTVAKNMDWGVPALADVECANEAYAAISEGTSTAKELAADKAFTVWMTTLIESERKALAVAIDVLGSESASAHRAAFIRAFKPVK